MAKNLHGEVAGRKKQMPSQPTTPLSGTLALAPVSAFGMTDFNMPTQKDPVRIMTILTLLTIITWNLVKQYLRFRKAVKRIGPFENIPPAYLLSDEARNKLKDVSGIGLIPFLAVMVLGWGLGVTL